jgi:hypothetical protein
VKEAELRMKRSQKLVLWGLIGLGIILSVWVAPHCLPLPRTHAHKIRSFAIARVIWMKLYMLEDQYPDGMEATYRLLKERASEWGQNGMNEAIYDWLVSRPVWPGGKPGAKMSGDTDGDGRKEFHDDWGNPFAIIRGTAGIGTRYKLSDGRSFRLLSVVDNKDLICTWAVGDDVLEIAYNREYVMSGAVNDSTRLLIFSIVGDGRVGNQKIMLSYGQKAQTKTGE